MKDIDFGFTEQENSWLPRKRKEQRDHSILTTVVLVEVVCLLTLFHFLVLPHLIPNIK